MSAQRYVSTSFWDDAWIQELEPTEKYLYLYLLTNPLTNIAGIYKITLRRMEFDTKLHPSDLRVTLAKFGKDGKAFFIDNEWIMLPNWTKHQRLTENSNVRKGIDRVLEDIPEDVFQQSVRLGYIYEYLEDLGRPLKTLEDPSTTSNYLDLDLDLDSDFDLDLSDSSCPNSDEPDELLAETELAEQLAQIILDYDPQARVPKSFKTWAKTIDRMIRIDKRTPEQILWLFRWSQNDEFWNPNIRSPDKLRKQWDKLVYKAKSERKPKQGKDLKDRLSGTMAALKRLEEEQ